MGHGSWVKKLGHYLKEKFQFERHAYFVADRLDHVKRTKLMLNLAVGLKGSWRGGVARQFD